MAALTSEQVTTFKALALRDGSSCVWCGRVLTPTDRQARVQTLIRRSTASAPRVLAHAPISFERCERKRGATNVREWLFVCVAAGRSPNWAAVQAATTLLAGLSRTRFRKRQG